MKIFIFDRDGVINIDKDSYVCKIKDFVFRKGIFEVICFLISHNYKIFIATNQSGIGRGMYTETDFEKLTNYMLNEFKKRNIKIEKVFYCPHNPEDNCECRKPKTKMVENLFSKNDINKNESFMIGDKDADILFGKRLGLKTIRVKSKYPTNIKANYIIEDLIEIKNIIQGEEK